MKKNNDSFDGLDVLDTGELRYSDLYEDLRENRNQYLIWLLEEFDFQFDRLLENINKNSTEQLYESAKRLLPYFKKHNDDENRSIRESAKLGIEQIKKRFPGLVGDDKKTNRFKSI
ncbi:MAG: hypothetical protein ACTSWY_09185 [Promethearchaeota archaeon]